MTCNPSCKEIKDDLLPGQQVVNWLNLTARVYWSTLCLLVSYITNEQVFRGIKARVRVIEFNKCSLPHAHCISFLSQFSRTAPLQPKAVGFIT